MVQPPAFLRRQDARTLDLSRVPHGIFHTLTKVASSWSLVSVVNTVFHSSNQQMVLECQSHEECDPRAPEGEQIDPLLP